MSGWGKKRSKETVKRDRESDTNKETEAHRRDIGEEGNRTGTQSRKDNGVQATGSPQSPHPGSERSTMNVVQIFFLKILGIQLWGREQEQSGDEGPSPAKPRRAGASQPPHPQLGRTCSFSVATMLPSSGSPHSAQQPHQTRPEPNRIRHFPSGGAGSPQTSAGGGERAAGLG